MLIQQGSDIVERAPWLQRFVIFRPIFSANMSPNFIKSKRGKNLLVSKGFVYHKHSSKKENTYWICSRKPECKTRATSRGDPPHIIREGTHDHAPDQDEVVARTLLNDIKEVSTQHPEMPPLQITSNRLQNIPAVVLAKLPNEMAVRRTINRVRQANLPPNPKTLEELGDIPDEYQQTSGGDRFLLWDSADYEDDDEVGGDRIIIFATAANLKLL